MQSFGNNGVTTLELINELYCKYFFNYGIVIKLPHKIWYVILNFYKRLTCMDTNSFYNIFIWVKIKTSHGLTSVELCFVILHGKMQ